MIPPVIDPATKSLGEKRIFELLRDDPLTKDWIAFHSIDIPRHLRQTVGEMDFVVIIPNKAVVCLEVKGHKRIRRVEGAWYLGSDPEPDFRGPFKQASEGTQSLRNLVSSNSDLSNIPFTWAVICPFVESIESVSAPEWLPWQLVTSTNLKTSSVGTLLDEIATSERKRLRSVPNAKWFNPDSACPTTKQCSALLQFLRPDFELLETPSAKRHNRESEIRHFTEEQFLCLDAMELNQQVIFQGPAGTGKTVLALEAARRESASGIKVLLLCYNRLLKTNLSASAETFGLTIDVRTVDALLIDIANHPEVPTGEGVGDFWRSTLPELALEAILDGVDSPKYDVLIIDEAQDVLRDSYIDVLDLVLTNGLSHGRWRIFGDFENQAIYGSADSGLAKVRGASSRYSEYSLRVNCRNTPRITQFVQLLGGLNPGYSRVLRSDNHYEPRIRYFAKPQRQLDRLEEALTEIFDDGFAPNDVVILSPLAKGSCAEDAASKSSSCRIQPLNGGQIDENAVRYGSIHSFKGLESAAVILTDIFTVGSSEAQSLFYTGITRATDRLFVLASEDIQKGVIEMITTKAAGRL